MEYPNLTKQESAELQEYLSTHQDDLLTHIVQFNELMRKYLSTEIERISQLSHDSGSSCVFSAKKRIYAS